MGRLQGQSGATARRVPYFVFLKKFKVRFRLLAAAFGTWFILDILFVAFYLGDIFLKEFCRL
jgi:hypothetical protein